MTESRIEAVAIARVFRLSGHQRKYILAEFRGPGTRGNGFAAEFLPEEPVRMHIAGNADEVSELG